MGWEEQRAWFNLIQASVKETDRFIQATLPPPTVTRPVSSLSGLFIGKGDSLPHLLHGRLVESGNLPRDMVCRTNSHPLNQDSCPASHRG